MVKKTLLINLVNFTYARMDISVASDSLYVYNKKIATFYFLTIIFAIFSNDQFDWNTVIKKNVY